MKRLTRHDWTLAALRTMARGGTSAVAVDTLAGELGATRGSFYWHFADREALVTTALELWEQVCTTDMIAALREVTDPRERLRGLFTEALAEHEVPDLEPTIVAGTHPAVAPVLRRVTRCRIAFLTEIYTELGLTPAAARRHAITAYAAYLGWSDLRHADPDGLPEVAATGRPAQRALDHLIAQITPGMPQQP
ncbi:MAG: TetR/AcrR family transcriptional regulator [Pseudonocardia sp.]|nr:TetR/AcrR family transcriptional regulator [Pseudonocardia sp.]